MNPQEMRMAIARAGVRDVREEGEEVLYTIPVLKRGREEALDVEIALTTMFDEEQKSTVYKIRATWSGGSGEGGWHKSPMTSHIEALTTYFQ